jgi:hypothetical protein
MTSMNDSGAVPAHQQWRISGSNIPGLRIKVCGLIRGSNQTVCRFTSGLIHRRNERVQRHGDQKLPGTACFRLLDPSCAQSVSALPEDTTRKAFKSPGSPASLLAGVEISMSHGDIPRPAIR